MAFAVRELYRSVQRVYEDAVCASVHLAVVNCHAHCWNRTTSVRGSMGPPSLCTQPVAAVRRALSGSCTDQYSGCTKMPFALECSLWGSELPCVLLESYTFCTRLHGTSQFVYTAYGKIESFSNV